MTTLYPPALPWLYRLSATRCLLIMLLGVAALLAGCASSTPPAGMQVVNGFDVKRYQGRWYEIARLDHWFERDMTDVSATYLPQSDGSVQVINRGLRGPSGQWKEAIGKALFTGPSDKASLKVSFFGPFYGGYHVVALDPNYRWALVVGENRSYAWILAREKSLPRESLDAIVQRAQALGIDTQAFIWVAHTNTDPAHQP